MGRTMISIHNDFCKSATRLVYTKQTIHQVQTLHALELVLIARCSVLQKTLIVHISSW